MKQNWLAPDTTVDRRFMRLRDEGVFETMNHHLLMRHRERVARQTGSSAAMIDSQSIKTREIGGLRGYDAGKKVAGRKRHAPVDNDVRAPVLQAHPTSIQDRDGGGAWALIEVRALIAPYDEHTSGHEVLADFDFVAANSGGSLVLGGLVENLRLGGLVGYFHDETKRKSTFSRTSSWGDRALRALTGIGPKYSAENKLPAIQRLLLICGNLILNEAIAGVPRTGNPDNVHLLLIGFDYDRNRACFFRSAPAAGPQWGKGDPAGVTLAEAIHASTNAPLNYFDAPAAFPDRPRCYWDGVVTGCNNPILAAVTEAIVKGQAPTDIVALSLGTGTVALAWPTAQDPANSPYVQAIGEPGLVADLRKLATSILDDPPDIASILAHVMTGGGAGVPAPARSRIIGMNPLISPMGQPGNWRALGPNNAPMTAAQFTYLTRLEMDAVEQPQVDAIDAFAQLWLQGSVSNQPLRRDGDTLAVELGYGSFQDAAAAWRRLKQL